MEDQTAKATRLILNSCKDGKYKDVWRLLTNHEADMSTNFTSK